MWVVQLRDKEMDRVVPRSRLRLCSKYDPECLSRGAVVFLGKA